MDIDLDKLDDWVRWAISGGIFVFFLGLAFLSKVIMTRVVTIFTRRTKTNLDDLIIKALKTPVFLVLIVLGIWLAVVQVPELADHRDIAHRVCVILYIAIGAMVVSRIVDALLTWYGTEVATRTHTNIDDKLLPILRRVEKLIVYSIAFMIILDQLHVNISPLIAGLGIGGLAVALALQSTLSNFLAGTYVTTDAVIRNGHYILMDSGTEGFVEEIGWRTTKVRDWQGNLIIIPNSKLAEAIVTDYDVPEAPMLFKVACGVSYESDLQKVERVSLEVAREVMQKFPEGAKDFEPVVRFNGFGDSNINFAVVLKATNRPNHFPLKSELIKALHKRFAEEGIVIEYPVRRLYFAEGQGAERPALAGPRESTIGGGAITEETTEG